MKDRNIEEHPAYGMIMFSHVQGGNPNLFGSSVGHDDKILMRVSRGSVERSLNNDWYHSGKLLCEVAMSPTQFAEAITSMNKAPGVPVTILATEKDGCAPPMPKFVNKRRQFIDEFRKNNKESAATVESLIGQVETLFEKKNITKKDKSEILSTLNRIKGAVGSHNAFVVDQFNEATDKIVNEAKGEVEAFIQHRMMSLAAKALAEGDDMADPKQIELNLKATMLGKDGMETPLIPAEEEPLERDFFTVYEKNGEKWIHYCGYSAKIPDDNVDFCDGSISYSSADAPLEDVLSEGAESWFTENAILKQTEGCFTYSPEEFRREVNGFFDGRPGTQIRELSTDTPCGDYWCAVRRSAQVQPEEE